MLYFIDENILINSTFFSTDDFKNDIIEKTSYSTFNKIRNYFDNIIKLEEKIVNLNFKISMLEDGKSKIDKLMYKCSNLKKQISEIYFATQNLIIEEFFNNEYEQITNLEELENLRKRLYKFSDIIGSNKDYHFFDNYYIQIMNKLEHKCNILENG